MRLFTLTLLMIAMTIPTQSSADDQLLYLASTADKTIVAYNIDDDSGLLTKEFSVDLPGNGGAMALDCACTSGMRADRMRDAAENPIGVITAYEQFKRDNWHTEDMHHRLHCTV